MLRTAHTTATLVAVFFCTASLAQLPTLPPQAQAGDLIFRTGTEGISHAVMAIDQGLYSHVGVLIGNAARWQVLHATPAERPSSPDAVVLDELSFYLHPQRASAFQVFHVRAASAQQRQRAVDWALAQKGRRFHMLDPAQGTYCTTLAWDAWAQAGITLPVQRTQLALPLLSGTYLLPSALAASPRLQALPAQPIASKP